MTSEAIRKASFRARNGVPLHWSNWWYDVRRPMRRATWGRDWTITLRSSNQRKTTIYLQRIFVDFLTKTCFWNVIYKSCECDKMFGSWIFESSVWKKLADVTPENSACSQSPWVSHLSIWLESMICVEPTWGFIPISQWWTTLMGISTHS